MSEQSPKPVFLLGLPGVGKSSSGRRLAGVLGYRFADLDRILQEKTGMTVAEFFTARGEIAFRKAEHQALTETEWTGIVLATGGGTACFFENMEWMIAHGVTVYLEAPLRTLRQRIEASQNERPLFSGLSENALEQKLSELLQERKMFYEKAALRWEVLRESTDAFAERLLKFNASDFG